MVNYSLFCFLLSLCKTSSAPKHYTALLLPFSAQLKLDFDLSFGCVKHQARLLWENDWGFFLYSAWPALLNSVQRPLGHGPWKKVGNTVPRTTTEATCVGEKKHKHNSKYRLSTTADRHSSHTSTIARRKLKHKTHCRSLESCGFS